MQPDPLANVRRSAADVRRARNEYRRTVVAARAAGCTFRAIGDAAGVSPQAVAVIVERARGRNEG